MMNANQSGQMHTHSRPRALAAIVTLCLVLTGQLLHAQDALPERLSDSVFWTLVTSISEPGGYFAMADNFVSNERDIGHIAGIIRQNGPAGGVYLGVGPEQNLTYIAAVRPRMAFIVDIRRQAVIHHLMYKALFEMSKDRADFIATLFARTRPAGIDSATSITRIWEAFAPVGSDSAAARRNLALIRERLVKTHGFALTSDELLSLDHVYNSFVRYGPHITTSGPPGRAISVVVPSMFPTDTVALAASIAAVRAAARAALGAAGTTPSAAPPAQEMFTSTQITSANFMNLTSVVGGDGLFNSFLGSEESFRFIKDLHERNLFVPGSGNFSGPKAIRAVGEYVKQHGATISAFYVSNVESYLFGDRIADAFYANVSTLPVNEKSVFIRPAGFRRGIPLCPIGLFLQAVAAGRVTTNALAVSCTL